MEWPGTLLRHASTRVQDRPEPAGARSIATTIRERIRGARDLLFDALKASGATALIEAALACNGRPLLFAGAVRDAVFTVEHGTEVRSPRDLDVGLVGMPREAFDGLLRELGAEPNRYGGYRVIQLGAPPLDVWRLEETLGLGVHNAPCELVNILRSFVLDINAIVFDPLSGFFHACGAVEAIRARRVGLTEGVLLHSADTFAAKAILSAIRFSLTPSASLEQFVWRYLRPATLAYEVSKSFGPQVYIQEHSGPAAESANET